jgi:carboxyl-terminal processing protease
MLEQNPHFNSLRHEARLRGSIGEGASVRAHLDSAALNTPFRDNLPDTEKLAGLSKFWSEVKYNFGYPEKLVELDWDNLYLHAVPKVLATKSTAEYY